MTHHSPVLLEAIETLRVEAADMQQLSDALIGAPINEGHERTSRASIARIQAATCKARIILKDEHPEIRSMILPILDRIDANQISYRRRDRDEPHAMHLHRLLRTCRVRKGDCSAAENGKEFAPVHIESLCRGSGGSSFRIPIPNSYHMRQKGMLHRDRC